MEEKHGAQRDQPRAELTDVTAAIVSRSSHLQSPATGGSYAPRVHMIKLTDERDLAPYVWVHPEDDDRLQAPPMLAPSEANSDGLTHPGCGTLRWQIAARPLTVY